MHGAADQLVRIGLFPVFGHALAVGHAAQHHVVAHQCVNRRAQLHGLVHFGQDGLLLAFGFEGTQGVVQCVAMAAGVQHHQAAHMRQVQHVQHVALARVARRHAGSVDQHHLLAAQQAQQVLQRGLVVRQVRHDAQHAAIRAQLFVRADAVGVQGDQTHAAGAMGTGAHGGQLGGGGGLADTGRTDQGIDAAFFVQRRGTGLEVALEHVHQPAHRLARVQRLGHALQHGACQRG